MMPSSGEGVLYVATEHARFLTEARQAAESLKRWMPEVHVTLFTDNPDTAAALQAPFDAVEALPRVEGLGASWGWGLLNKIRACVRSPYERSLYLDTDTRVLSPRIREFFTFLDTHDVALARCEDGESRCQRVHGLPMFNAGIIAFRRSPRVASLLQAWQNLHETHLRALADNRTNRFAYLRHLGASDRYAQLINDQTALAQFLAPGVNTFEVNCLTVPRIWNWRRNEIDVAHRNDVVIHHADRFKVAS